MSIERLFHSLITAQFLLLFVIFIKELVGYSLLPGELKIYADALIADASMTSFGLVLTILFLIVYIASLVMIYRYVYLGRILFTFSLLVSGAFYLVLGAMINDPLDAFFQDASALINGFLLCMLFWTPLKEKFAPSPITQST